MKKLQLLSDGKLNHKIGKNNIKEIRIFSLNLRPHETDVEGRKYNVCPWAGECVKICVGDNGHFSMKKGSAYKAQLRKTILFFTDPNKFFVELFEEITDTYNKYIAKGIVPVYRLNAYSDLNFERLSVRYMGKNIFSTFDQAIFYDYSKDLKKVQTNNNSNYSLTYSVSEKSIWSEVTTLLHSGKNAAIIFEEVPETYKGFKCIDGDLTDNRFLDEQGVIVALKFKGSKKELLQSIAAGVTVPKIAI